MAVDGGSEWLFIEKCSVFSGSVHLDVESPGELDGEEFFSMSSWIREVWSRCAENCGGPAVAVLGQGVRARRCGTTGGVVDVLVTMQRGAEIP